MNKYIFFTMNIAGIGGAQQYVANKVNFLSSHGWDVYVFSSFNRAILIEGLKEYEKYIIPSIMYNPLIFSRKEIEKTRQKIVSLINYSVNDNIIIESNGTDSALWGEYIASSINAKHIYFCLQERHYTRVEELEFLNFKLARHELAGIVKQTVPLLLNAPSIEVKEDMIISAYCNNVVADIEEHYSSLIKNDSIVIGSIGRLEKPYVLPMIESIVHFCKTNDNHNYSLILIGGGPADRIREIKTALNNTNNVELIITGPLFPIPKRLIQHIDIFISAAGSATVSFREGKPTIKVNPNTGETLGIMGFSYQKKNMYNSKTDETIENGMNLILNKLVTINYPADDYFVNMENEFTRQLKIAQILNETDYYDVLSINLKSRSYKDRFYKILGKVFGGDGMQTVLEFLRQFSVFSKQRTV